MRLAAAVWLALVAVGFCASPSTAASRHPPTRLWQSFPLEPRPAPPPASPSTGKGPPPSHATASAPAGSNTDSGAVSPALLAGLLLALGAATLVVLRMTGAGAAVVARSHELPGRIATTARRAARPSASRDRGGPRLPRLPRLPRPHPSAGQMRKRIRRAPSLGGALNARLQEYKAVSEPAPLHLEVPRRPQDSPPPARDVGEDHCEVGVWHGYTRSQFYVWTGSDADRALEVSDSFRSRGDEPEPTAEAIAALDELLGRLEQDWEVVEEGPRWYDRRLRVASGHIVPAAHATRPTGPALEQPADPQSSDD